MEQAASTESDSDTEAPPRDVSVTDGQLSFGQRRLWFLARLEPESTAYNMPMPLRLHGALDVDALRAAIGDLMARHESLRTRFVDDDGEPRAVIDRADAVAIELPVEHVATVEAMHALLAEESSRPFDLASGPIARWRLARRVNVDRSDEPDHLLILHVHHIAYDGWSHGVVLRELAAAYEARAAGGAPELAPLPMSYADHAARQTAALGGPQLDLALSSRRRILDGLEPLALPLDRPRPAWPTRRGGTASIRLPAALATRVRAYGRRHGRTLFATLAAAFESLLHNLTGSLDLAIGVPDAGRPHSDLEGIVGFFVDLLVVRTDLTDDPRFDDLAAQIQTRLLDARDHADVPFDKLVEALAPPQHNDRSPFFQVTFQAVDEASISTFGDLRVSQIEATIDHAKFDLSVGAFDLGDEIEIHVLYAAELFDTSTIERWLDLYARLLDQAMDAPRRRLSELWALPAGDAERLAPADEIIEAPDGSLVDAFARHVAERPDAMAAVYPDGSSSYRQLDRGARRLAATLIAQGIRPGDRVGSAFGRSIDLLVSMIGIGYAGAAYVPIDPELPADRVEAMLDDTATRHVVLRGDAVSYPPSITRHDLDTLALDVLDPERLDSDADGTIGPLVAVDASSPAYVIFTSGSTGRPKGVEVPHGAVLNMLSDPCNAFDAESTMAQLANPAFDVSGREIWLALTRGGRLHGVERDDVLDPRRLARRFDAGGVTHCHLPAAVFHEIVAQGPSFLGRLRSVVVGGDRVDPTAVRQALAAGVTLVQSYGPTETAIDVTFQVVDAVSDDATAVPIGRAVPRVDLHVVGGGRRPRPR
ncbi:MAG: condensation domain-containing protein, partial [Acidobacteriota bacterium]